MTVDINVESADYLSIYGHFDPVDGDPDSPNYPAYGIAVSGDYLFVGTTEAGLVVMDVTDPTAPTRIVDTGNVGFTPRRLRLSGPYIYAAAGGDGFRIIQLQ